MRTSASSTGRAGSASARSCSSTGAAWSSANATSDRTLVALLVSRRRAISSDTVRVASRPTSRMLAPTAATSAGIVISTPTGDASMRASRRPVSPSFTPGIPELAGSPVGAGRGVGSVTAPDSSSEARRGVGTPTALPAGRGAKHPVGSTAPPGGPWTIPVCVRYDTGGKADPDPFSTAKPEGRIRQTCALLAAPTGAIDLPMCPDWILPNADAAGYYRSALAAADVQRLRERGLARLSTVERVGLGHDLEAAFASAELPGGD